MEVGGKRHALAALSPGKRLGTHRKGSRVGPRAGLDGFGSFRLCRNSIPKLSSLLRVATPTELLQPTVIIIKVCKIRTILLSGMYSIAAHVVIKITAMQRMHQLRSE